MKRKDGKFICNENEIDVWVPEGDYIRLVNDDRGYKFEFYDFDVNAREEDRSLLHALCEGKSEEYEREFPECVKARLTVPMLAYANMDEQEFMSRIGTIRKLADKGKIEKLDEYLLGWHKEVFED